MEFIEITLKNHYLLQKILKCRKELVNSLEWQESVSRPLHVLIAEQNVEMLRYSLHKFAYQHFAVLSHAIKNQSSNLYSSNIPIRPIDTAAYVNRLDILKYLHKRLDKVKEEFFGAHVGDKYNILISQDAISWAARHSNLEMVQYLAQELKWSTITDSIIIDAINGPSGGLDIIKYLKSTTTTNWAFKDDALGPIYSAISRGDIGIDSLCYLVQVCTLETVKKSQDDTHIVGSSLVANRAFHHAIRSSNHRAIEIIYNRGDGIYNEEGDEYSYWEAIISAITSNNLETIHFIIDLFKLKHESALPPTKNIRTPTPFLQDIVLSKNILEYIQNLSSTSSNLISFKFNLNVYINNGRLDLVEYLLNNNMAYKVFDPTELVEKGDLTTMLHLTNKVKLPTSQKVSILSAIETGNLKMMQHVYKNLMRIDPSREDKETKQNKLALKLLWYNTTRKQQQEKDGSGSDGSGGYLECLKFAVDNQIIDLNNIANSLVYWNGDKELIEKIPTLVKHLKKNQPKRMVSVLQFKLENNESPTLTYNQLFSNTFTNRPSFYHGTKEIIEIFKSYFESSIQCCHPLGDWACHNEDLDLIKYLVSIGNPALFTKKAIDNCLRYHKSPEILQYLMDNVFQNVEPTLEQLCISRNMSIQSLLLNSYPWLSSTLESASVATFQTLFQQSYISKQYCNIFHLLDHPNGKKVHYSLPQYTFMSSDPLDPSINSFWKTCYPIIILIRYFNITPKLCNHLSTGVVHQDEYLSSNPTSAKGAKSGDDIVIVAPFRTAVAKAKRGGFKDTSPDDILAPVIKHILKVTKIDPSLITDVVMGSVLPRSSQGATEIRVASLIGGLPKESACMTVNRQCSSGLQAIANVAAAVAAGHYEVGLAGGVESMTLNPMSWEGQFNEVAMNDPVASGCYNTMGQTSENVAERFNISRKEQDEFAVLSHKKAGAAQAAGKFKDEIVPVTVKTEDGKEVVIDKDEGIRVQTTVADLAKLKPAFKEGGSTTAGNSSQLSDGAAACLVMKRSTAQRLGLQVALIFRSFVAVGVEPAIMGVGPAAAIPAAVKKAGLSLADIDVYEINEAFASQAYYSIKHLNIPMEKVNPNGGGIALGHPLGCTGARMTATLYNELKRRNARYGVVSMCIGTGMGAAAVFEKEN
ncbi:acetyl-CoA C-acyltransferase [Cavenderia fasciculata]|uniref:acetyl-CoA C-acyltransferase n=1 Tax=Cavenderia fasciculata TaxID=261658 RepID=F4PPZ1_CACFS|nr:acetyl-CoA C-acyltransferase [Cavenderia fasciculata]EGG22454.1 acetyl-CoA C-acyltransferase [Cavenderia fasciculata]|eukprot:XP_004360305.1 acetyl-CoA C-acyltransferase [Cavenderia fasciculata]